MILLLVASLLAARVAASVPDPGLDALPQAPKIPRILEAKAVQARLLSSVDNATNATAWLSLINGVFYINLPDTDNWSEYGLLRTVWSKLQIIGFPATGGTSVTVNLTAWSFSSSNGAADPVGMGLTQVEWGIAADCRGKSEGGSMRINLVGTPFSYEAVYPAVTGSAATFAHGSVTCTSASNQSCQATCGGFCGYCGLGIPTVATTAVLKVWDQAMFDAGAQIYETTTMTTTTSATTTTHTSSSSTTTSLTTTTTNTSTTSSSSTSTSTTSTSTLTSTTNTSTTTTTSSSTTNTSSTMTSSTQTTSTGTTYTLTTTPEPATRVTFSMTVQNVDYAQLTANASLVFAFEEGLKETIASFAGPSITADHVEVKLSSGSVNVESTIIPPKGISANDLGATLVATSSFLTLAVVNTINNLEGMEAAITGTIQVTSISSPTVDQPLFSWFKFAPLAIRAGTTGTTFSCCCSHSISEMMFRSCGVAVNTAGVVATNAGGSSPANSSAQQAVDGSTATKWVDLNQQPLVLQFSSPVQMDEYAFAMSSDCEGRDPVRWDFYGSFDGSAWQLLHSQAQNYKLLGREQSTDWFSVGHCKLGTTSTTTTATSYTATSVTTSTSSTSSTTATVGNQLYYERIFTGSCSDVGMYSIPGPAGCEAAARSLDLADTSVTSTAQDGRPEGCYYFGDEELWLSISPLNKGRGAEMSGNTSAESRHPICSSSLLKSRFASSSAFEGQRRYLARRAVAAAAIVCSAVMATVPGRG